MVTNMSEYKLQINWHFPEERHWATIGEFSELTKGLARLKHDSDLSRVCAPLRLIDEANVVHQRYYPEYDYRLQGCFYRNTKQLSHQLWEKAGSPECDGTEFWFEAERQLNEVADTGLREGDFTEEEIETKAAANEQFKLYIINRNNEIKEFFTDLRHRVSNNIDLSDLYRTHPDKITLEECVLYLNVDSAINMVREKSHEEIMNIYLLENER